jgi:hypothetical protein
MPFGLGGFAGLDAGIDSLGRDGFREFDLRKQGDELELSRLA